MLPVSLGVGVYTNTRLHWNPVGISYLPSTYQVIYICEVLTLCFTSCTEQPALPDSSENSLKVDKCFHILINKFENLHYHGNIFPVMLNVILNIIDLQNFPDAC